MTFFADKPISLFGHSMGALIAFELARKLYYEKKLRIKNLFLSAHRAPSLPLIHSPVHQNRITQIIHDNLKEKL